MTLPIREIGEDIVLPRQRRHRSKPDVALLPVQLTEAELNAPPPATPEEKMAQERLQDYL